MIPREKNSLLLILTAGRVIEKINKENKNKMVNYICPTVCNTNLQRVPLVPHISQVAQASPSIGIVA